MTNSRKNNTRNKAMAGGCFDGSQCSVGATTQITFDWWHPWTESTETPDECQMSTQLSENVHEQNSTQSQLGDETYSQWNIKHTRQMMRWNYTSEEKPWRIFGLHSNLQPIDFHNIGNILSFNVQYRLPFKLQSVRRISKKQFFICLSTLHIKQTDICGEETVLVLCQPGAS